MLIRIPEVLFGALLAVAIFAMGLAIGSSSIFPQYQQQPQSVPAASHGEGKDNSADERIALYTLWLAAFTGALVLSTIGL
jgi:hypothetical protein